MRARKLIPSLHSTFICKETILLISLVLSFGHTKTHTWTHSSKHHYKRRRNGASIFHYLDRLCEEQIHATTSPPPPPSTPWLQHHHRPPPSLSPFYSILTQVSSIGPKKIKEKFFFVFLSSCRGFHAQRKKLFFFFFFQVLIK